MRSSNTPRLLECHGFVCQTPEDAIVIAATLYQSLMAHMGSGEVRVKFSHSKKRPVLTLLLTLPEPTLSEAQKP